MTSTIEQDIQAAGANVAPRITPDDLQANIVSEHYFTAADGILADKTVAGVPQSLSLLTFCVLVLRNGFTVTGESACASPANFNAEIGRKVARANAVEKMWPLMGYALKEKLHASEQFKARTGREDRRGLAQTVVVMGEDFPLGKACDLSGDGTCESCQ